MDFDCSSVLKWLGSISARRVLIQSPLGLRGVAERLEEAVRKAGVEAFISASPTWGGCDIAVEEAKRIGADAVIHVGHAPFLSQTELPVFYVEARYTDYTPLKVLIEPIVETLKGHKRVGLGATVQWLDHLPSLAQDLTAEGFEIVIGERGGHLAHNGQVLGCDYSTLKSVEHRVDCFLVIGSVFHALGIALISEKPTLMADPLTRRLEWMGDRAKRILSTRYFMIQRFREAHRIGIIVSRKPGQYLMGLAQKLRAKLEKAGREASIIISDEISADTLADFSFEAYVNTACPRLSIEDQARFSKPLLLPVEVLVALNDLSWDEVVERGMLLHMSTNLI